MLSLPTRFARSWTPRSRGRATSHISAVPVITSNPSSQGVTEPTGATFTVTATGPVPLFYQWQRNGVNISGATSSSYTLNPTSSGDNNAQFRCVITNAFGSATSNAATLTVASGNEAPAWSAFGPVTFTIGTAQDYTLPVTDANVGDTVTLSSIGTALPSGVSLVNPNILRWSGSGFEATTTGHQIRADDGVADAVDVTTFSLTSTVGGTLLPWSFGHAFAVGDVPSGQYITSNVSDFQAEVRNTWSDGSVRFAVLSGRSTMSANTPISVSIRRTATVPTGSNIASVTAGDVGTTTVTFGSAGTVSLADAINGANLANYSGSIGSRPASAGRLRSIPGRVMTEEHFYAPFPSQGHLCVFWYVRKYLGGRIEIETAVEQGWARVSGPVEVSGAATVVVNGVTVYSAASIAHRHHARWSRVDWIGDAPSIRPKHNMAYLKSTKLVPNYMGDAVQTEVQLAALTTSVAPMTRGMNTQAAAGGGYQPHLGLSPYYDAIYITSDGDSRAYDTMMAHLNAANCYSASFGTGFVWRDESTLLPVRTASFYNDSYSNGYSPTYGAGKIFQGSNTSGSVWYADPAHGFNAGYLPYLVTGRWYALETVQFNHASDFLCWGIPSGANGGARRWMSNEDRATGWSFRTMACALSVTPQTISDQSSYRSGLISHITFGVDYWHANEINTNELGIRRNIYNNTDYGPAPYNTAGGFQQAFVAQSWGLARDLIRHDLASTQQSQIDAIALFHAKYPVGMAGTRPGGWCWMSAAQYEQVVGPDRADRAVCYTFGEAYDVEISLGRQSSECGNNTLRDGNFPTATSYWGNYLPALAYAADMTAPGASDSWSRITGASNWGTLKANFTTAPQFAIVPRST